MRDFISKLTLIVVAGFVLYLVLQFNTEANLKRVDRFLSVDGLALSEQQAIARKAGNSRYYSNQEIESYIEQHGPKE